MSFQIINQKFLNYQLDEEKIFKILNTLFKNEKKEFELVSIILQNDKYLKNLKNIYFNQDVYTDVISFNLEDSGLPIDGEIYISLPRVIDNANKFKSNLNDEFKRIIIHGLLHLVGYNDKTEIDKKNMINLENKYININPGVIISYE